MYHFRKNVYPSADVENRHQTRSNPYASSSIHYNSARPQKKETAAQIRQRKLQEYKSKTYALKDKTRNTSGGSGSFSSYDASGGSKYSIQSSVSGDHSSNSNSNSNDPNAIFRARTAAANNNKPIVAKQTVGVGGEYRNEDSASGNLSAPAFSRARTNDDAQNTYDYDMPLKAGTTTVEMKNIPRSYSAEHSVLLMTNTSYDNGEAIEVASDTSSLIEDLYTAIQGSNVKKLSKTKIGKQIRERKLQEYKAKKELEQYGGVEPMPLLGGEQMMIPRSRTAESHDTSDTIDVNHTVSFDERAHVSRSNAHRQNELYFPNMQEKQDGVDGIEYDTGVGGIFRTEKSVPENQSIMGLAQKYNNNHQPSEIPPRGHHDHHLGTPCGNQYKTAAQIRERKIQEYNEKKFAENYDQSGGSGSDGYLLRARTTDWSSNNNRRDRTMSADELHRAGSDGMMLYGVPDTAFEERVQVTRARADKLSELYAMQAENLDRPLTIKTPPRNKHEAAAQIRERKKREYKAKKHEALMMNRLPQIEMSSSFDGVIMSRSAAGDYSVEASLPASYSFDDAASDISSLRMTSANDAARQQKQPASALAGALTAKVEAEKWARNARQAKKDGTFVVGSSGQQQRLPPTTISFDDSDGSHRHRQRLAPRQLPSLC